MPAIARLKVVNDMRYLFIPLAALMFGFLFAQSAFAADGRVCTMQYAPVCAAQHVQCITAPCYPVYRTYGNQCLAESDGADILHQGECTGAETGPVKPSQEAYTPPAGCTAWFDGCNSCSRQEHGGAVCTLRACLAPAAGYCTQYGSPPHATGTPPGEATSSASATSSAMGGPVATAVPAALPSGFLHAVWIWILHLLRF